jgi:tetratricopeptide (TPR) repeat protein
MRRSRTSFIVVALLAPLLLVVSVAAAQPKGNKEKEKAAKAYVDAGLAAQERGDQDTAIAMYAKAYELVPVPILVFNMAQAHRLAGRTQVAIDHYKRYLADEPKGAKARTAREFITALEGQLILEESAKAKAAEEEAARKAEEARKAAAADAARKAEDARRAEEARRAGGGDGKQPRGGDGGAVAPIDGEGDGDDGGHGKRDGGGGGGGLRKVGLTSAALGVISLGVSIPFGLKAKSIADELSVPGTTFDADKDASGKAAGNIHLITTVAGGALLVGGVTMYFIGRSKRNDGVAFVPVVDPDHVGIVVRGAY